MRRLNTFALLCSLTLVFVLLSTSTSRANENDLQDWLQSNAMPFTTDDPTGDLSDLASLSDMVGDARIVSLGEGTHGTAEFFRMKHRILRYLVEEEGFRVFLIEANMPETIAVNEYVLEGEGSARDGIDSMGFWTWRTQEILNMIEWMREWNISNPDDPVYFHGFDSQTRYHDGLERFLGYLDTVDLAYADSIREDIQCFSGAEYTPVTVTDDCQDILMSIAQAYSEEESAYIEASSTFDYILHRQILITLITVTNLVGTDDTDYFNIRDRAMADHVIAFAEELFPEERFVLWAHNGHVAESADDVTPMGHNLHNHFGDDYLSVGFAFKNGDFNAISFIDGEYGALRSMTVLPLIEGSHETIFASADIPRYILDLRVEEGTLAHAWLSESYYFRYIGALYNPSAETEEFTYPTVLYGTFDLMIYFEDTSPSVLL